MIKEILILLWVFILPIIIWAGKFFSSLKYNNQQESTFRKSLMYGYFGLEIFIYLLGIVYIVWRFRASSDFLGELKDSLCFFALFQVAILDLWCLLFSFCPTWITSNGKYKLSVETKVQKNMELYFSVIKNFCDFILSMSINMIKNMYFIFVFFLICLHGYSIQDVFMEQKLPFIFILIILFFNPIYMFYQLRERLFKNG